MCEDCWFKKKAIEHAGGRDFAETIKELFEKQGRRCFYTGEALIPGINASVDHIVPRAKGGKNCISNLQWVCKSINAMKNNCTHDEFVRFCHSIAERFPLSAEN